MVNPIRELETVVGRLGALEDVAKRVQNSDDLTALKSAIADLCELMRREMKTSLPDDY